jgi:hypothetical protein
MKYLYPSQLVACPDTSAAKYASVHIMYNKRILFIFRLVAVDEKQEFYTFLT